MVRTLFAAADEAFVLTKKINPTEIWREGVKETFLSQTWTLVWAHHNLFYSGIKQRLE